MTDETRPEDEQDTLLPDSPETPPPAARVGDVEDPQPGEDTTTSASAADGEPEADAEDALSDDDRAAYDDPDEDDAADNPYAGEQPEVDR